VRFGWRGALGIALSAFLLWYTLRGEDLGEIWGILSSSSLLLWGACVVAATAIFPLRARRWQALLAPLGPRIPMTPLWHATAIGMMVNNVFPARAGEFARAFALSRARPEIKFTTAFGSLVVDRLFDGTMVLALLLLATLDPRFPSDARVEGVAIGNIVASAALFLGAVLIVVVALVLWPQPMRRLAERVIGSVWARGGEKVGAMLESFAGGLQVLRSPRLVLEVLWWTLLHWLLNAFAFWLAFRALDIDAPMSAALFVQGLIAIGVALPSAPGFFGPFELAGKAGLGLYGVSSAEAVSWAIGFHILSFIPITVLGAWYFSRMHLHVSDLSGSASAAGPEGST
jgi:glycosyltransferase 2 family protein